MSFVASTLKVVVGLAVFASLMILEFASYTRAVAEEDRPAFVSNSKPISLNLTTTPVKKSSKNQR